MRNTLTSIILSPFTRLNDFSDQTYWLTYLSGTIIILVAYIWSRRGKSSSLRRLFRYLFPHHFWKHPSVRLDLKLYVASSIYLAVQSLFIFTNMGLLGGYVAELLSRIGTPSSAQHPTPLVATIAIPVFLFLAFELGYWLGHYAMHRIPVLWEFHKVHHNAEILTPLTEWRQHPLEYMIIPTTIMLTLSLTYGVINWLYGPQPTLLSYWNLGVILLVMNCTIVHLRHTQVNIHARGWLGRLIQSPGHHQIHHSVEEQHFDKNFGFCLSLWDWAFGTLVIPEKKQRLRYGISRQHRNTDHRVTSQWITPFYESGKIIFKRRKRNVALAPLDGGAAVEDHAQPGSLGTLRSLDGRNA